MSFSQRAAYNIVPLLARLVLGAAFITAGLAKLGTQTFEGESARLLDELRAPAAQPPTPGTPGSPGTPGTSGNGDAALGFDRGFILRTVALRQDEAGAQDEGEQDAGEQGDDDTATQPPIITDPTRDPSNGRTVLTVPTLTTEGRALHGIALLVAGSNEGLKPYAIYLAWAAALTELIGGGLLLIGLFARLWGLALAGVMAVAFYLTSLDIVTQTWIIHLLPDHTPQFNTVFNQLGLMVLAFGIFLTGAGALSLDRFIFGRSGGAVEPADDFG